MKNLRGKIAIVGAAESDLGEVAQGLGPVDLMAQATHRALEDAGLQLADIDGVFTATTQLPFPALSLCEYLRISPRYVDGTNLGGSSFMSHIGHALAAIHSGMCEVALIAYGSNQRTVGRSQSAPQEISPYDAPYSPRFPLNAYALAAARHMHEFGTTREQLAEVAVAARQWALLNPKAWEKTPLTVEDVLSAPIVSSPLTVRDCCLVTDGGGALIVTSADRAKYLKKAPVYVLGIGDAVTHRHVASMPTLTTTGARLSGERAYAMSGLSAKDIDVIELYDAFTICTILFLEDLGFCKKGEGGGFVQNGQIGPNGTWKVNTSGGGLSYCHPGMYGLMLLIESVRQLRAECGARQVAAAETAIVHGNGGVLSSESTVVLGLQSTL
jgi:acetyl-CoA acetyltransferase